MYEFTGVLCDLFLLFLMVVLPVYTGNTYYQLGDTKYAIFKNTSLICLGLWGVLFLAQTLLKIYKRKAGKGNKKEDGAAEREKAAEKTMLNLSTMDKWMLVYGCFVLLSALCSEYHRTPWFGYKEWYMGAISQGLFLGIYFMMSRSYSGKAYPVYAGEACFFILLALGFLHRLGLDVSGLMKPFNSGDWEYSHMISTLGNINWFCGYCSVMLGFPIAGYLKSKKILKKRLLYVVSVTGLLLLCIQGSDAGVVIAAAGIGISLLYGLHNCEIFQRGLAMVTGLCLGLAGYGVLVRMLGEEAYKAIPADGIGRERILWSGWWLAAVFFFLLYLLFRSLPQRIYRVAQTMLLVLGGMTVLTAAIVYAVRLPSGDGWGSGRGGLWRFAWQGFLVGNFKQKLIGAGPDCFAAYIYTTLPATVLTPTEGFWTGSIYANAHNEWLNTLINLGILGTAAWTGIFAEGCRRYRVSLLGILVLGMYGINSLISFQQVLSTPLLFMVLGLCENRLRVHHADKEGEQETERNGESGWKNSLQSSKSEL